MKTRTPQGTTPSVVLVNPKYPHNVGAALRACSCFDLQQLWWTGDRVTVDPVKGERLPREERMKGYRDVALCPHERPFDFFPATAVPVAVEVRPNSECLTVFEHPDEAVYVFGPEDGSIPKAWLSLCHRFLFVFLFCFVFCFCFAHRVRAWKQLPSGLFVAYEEPGVCKGAPPKELRLAETPTTLRDEDAEQAVRTVVCREVVPGPKKDRWHPLFTTSEADPLEVLQAFRQRQHHEQGYRVGVHDLGLNATPCGYDKESPDRHRPRFHRGPLQRIGWLVALVYNAVADLAERLPERYWGAQVQTLRRTFFNRAGQLYCTPQALIVYLEPFREQEVLLPLIDQVNGQECRLPWLGNRRLVISPSPTARNRAGPSDPKVYN